MAQQQSQFFGNNQRGELQELYEDLNDLNFEKKKEAVKKVIAYMTVGKDVSGLFQPVIKCLEYNDIELKKLVYLYIVNYSRQKPDDAIMVIQLFRKDVRKTENPLVRALAVRSFGCLRVAKLNDYLIEPLKDAVQDEEAYVRKTAVLCVPKVYEVSEELVQNSGLVDMMQKMLHKESNALVLANLVIALKEIGDIKGENLITLNRAIIQKLLLAINECIEWAQIFILDFLAQYQPSDSQEAELVIERSLPRLSHSNPTVVFSTVKVILRYLDYLNDGELVKNLCKKITPSIVSLIAWNQPEIQYVILRNVSIILQKYPVLFENDVKAFFCSFNEPYYVKYEKLDIMVRICDNKNFQQVLTELAIYLNEVDGEFIRKSIKAIGKIAQRYEKSMEKQEYIAVSMLVEFASAASQSERDDVAVQELFVQMQNIYRRNRKMYAHENSLKIVVELSKVALEPQAKAACAWILGEFAEYIPDVLRKMTDASESFAQEERVVQLQVLTSSVKLFLKYPKDCEEFIMKLLTKATQSFNPDVVDRAYIYWRVLSIEPEKAKRLVCSTVSLAVDLQDKQVWETRDLDIALENMGSLSNLLHKLPHQFGKKKVISQKPVAEVSQPVEKQPKIKPPSPKQQVKEQQPPAPQQEINLLDLFASPQAQVQAPLQAPVQAAQVQVPSIPKPQQQESYDLI